MSKKSGNAMLAFLFGAAAGVLGSLVGLSKYLREAETKPAST